MLLIRLFYNWLSTQHWDLKYIKLAAAYPKSLINPSWALSNVGQLAAFS